MTVLENSVLIDASPDRVWTVLGGLGKLHEYDPGITKSEITSPVISGVGATRQCDLKPGGWLRERVVLWQPPHALAFELYDCTLPVKRLTHRYTLTARGHATLVEQRMEYQLKFGLLGALLDRLMVRRKWIHAIKAFFTGLKKQVEDARAE